MNRIRRIATWHPYAFSLLFTLLVLLFYIIAGVFAAVFSSGIVGINLIAALGRATGSLVFAFIILKFGWGKAAGLTRLGSPLVWIVGLCILAYEAATHVVPLMGGAGLDNSTLPETTSVALNALMTGPLEEFAFRGIILYAFVRLWADTESGILKSVLVSSLFFGASHLIHLLLGRPLPLAFVIAANAFMAGIYYAALVLRWNTLWPAVAIHGLLNALVAIVELNTPELLDPTIPLLFAVVLQLPVVLLGLYWISRAEPRAILPEAA